MAKKRKPNPLAKLANLNIAELMMLREACTSCAIEGNEAGRLAGQALDKISDPATWTDEEADALNRILEMMENCDGK